MNLLDLLTNPFVITIFYAYFIIIIIFSFRKTYKNRITKDQKKYDLKSPLYYELVFIGASLLIVIGILFLSLINESLWNLILVKFVEIREITFFEAFNITIIISSIIPIFRFIKKFFKK